MQRREAAVDPERVIDLWREVCVPLGLSDVIKLTPKRRQKINARLSQRDGDEQRGESWLRRYLDTIAATPFLLGDNGRGWRADFDFVFQSEETVTKVLEGVYARAPRTTSGHVSQEELLFENAMRTHKETA